MATCNGCGGIVGRDCFNPQECEWIANDQRRHYEDHQAQMIWQAQTIWDENLRLRELCGCAYQLAGYHDAPEAWLDVLSEAAQGMPISEWSVQGDLIEALLPYAPEPVELNGISAHPGELVSMTWAQYVALRNAALSHAAGQEVVEALIEEVQAFADAYPTDVFGPVTDEEREQHGSLITRASASMGRHMGRRFLPKVLALRNPAVSRSEGEG